MRQNDTSKTQKIRGQIFEGYPSKIQSKIEQRDRQRIKAVPLHTIPALGLVFEDLKLWHVGEIQVSFKGGDSALHGQIAHCAAKWCQYANIKFDFGFDEASGTYRTWTEDDYSHIRVGFEYDGYWSLVGTDSKDPSISAPGDITLNLQGFDVGLPEDWKGTTLHEFGHAIGFHHEHQSPVAHCDFDWPLLYEYLGGHPNYWPKAKVDFNLREMPAGGLTYGPHDKHSIMHYSFPSWMFTQGEQSPCFTDRNDDLSAEDIRMAKQAYPTDHALITALREKRIKNLEHVIAASKETAIDVLANFHNHLSFLRNIDKTTA